MYVAVKGGEKAIANAHKYLAVERRGDTELPELSVAQIKEQMRLAVDRVMTEGSLYDPDLAALALKQARGDSIEAIFLLRAYRTTLPRFYTSTPLNTSAMQFTRRISAAFKDMPGGQMLGPTFDYTHRLLDFSLADEEAQNDFTPPTTDENVEVNPDKETPRILDFLQNDELVEGVGETESDRVGDITREPLELPANRDIRLQKLTRADEGFVLAMGYSTQRGFKNSGGHPFAGEIRAGSVSVEIIPEELGFPVSIGDITVTESEIVSIYDGSDEAPPQFSRGYGITFGSGERKAISMALVDRALRCKELQEDIVAPAQDEEFVLMHSDNIEATGFVEHLKLPHHVDFQSELDILRRLRSNWAEGKAKREALEKASAQANTQPEHPQHPVIKGAA
ncbi:carbon-phosphorus lyase complex subunit PhnI [Halodesulfovibrio marinisediminis]|uniref:Alpha-D-ribose 1-methylphosphonate 5-triphosphate synthase subunit PhnI n=1 Tax=Halodesulfovibrio marinisediminis DSM 17456 TaxID=1121457 RepID=A0A1N6DWH8_9BACT|nr:carbon-phosphorus lyase complex subunit PhnI [Halodesulfovibrio marinisediminis]SIN75146.1 alpha-D-ribose 1-methylphosphonate 5-triphosphate synthase subunit PhnI [Halodesulfovibrio marinisediminis DSM 17456]